MSSSPRPDAPDLNDAFVTAASGERKPKRSTTTLSLRVTHAERAELERQAAGQSLSAFLKDRVLSGSAKPRRTRSRHPVKDYEALARILGKLGRADLYNRLTRLVLAVEEGRVHLEDDLTAELRATISDVAIMRRDLVKALGVTKG